MSDQSITIWFTVNVTKRAENIATIPSYVHGAYTDKAEALRMAIYVRQFYQTSRVECDVLDTLPHYWKVYADERHEDPHNLLRKEVAEHATVEVLEALHKAMMQGGD